MKGKTLVSGIAALLFLLALTTSGPALGEEAKVLLISWEATLEGTGETFSVVSPAGELTHLQLAGEGSKKEIAIAASVENQAEQVVSFRLFDVQQVSPTDKAFRQVEKFSVRPGATYSTAHQPVLKLRVTAINKESEQDDPHSTSPSDDLVSMEVKLPAKPTPVKLVGRSGEMSRIKGGNYSYGIVPSLQKTGTVNFRLFTIAEVQGAGEVLRQVESFVLSTGAEHASSHQAGLVVKLTGVKTRS